MHPLDTPVPESVLKVAEVPAPLQIPAINLTVDVKVLIEKFCEKAMISFNWAYPNGYFEPHKANTALQSMQHNVEAIQELLKAIK